MEKNNAAMDGPMAQDSDRAYPSMAGQGFVQVELPSPPGSPFPTETLHARDVPALVISRVERALNPSFAYLRHSVGEAAGNVFAHYVGALQGTELVDKATSRALDKLVKDFANTDKAEQPKFFAEKIRPYLAGMKSTKR